MSYTAIVDLRLKPDDLAGAGAAVKELLEGTRTFEGNQGVEVLVDEADPTHWLLVEHWASADANAAYSAWRAGEGKNTALGPYLAGAPTPSKYRVSEY